MERFDPTRGTFSPYGFTCVRWLSEATTRTDTHNEIEINFLPTGSIEYLHGGKIIPVSTGCMVVFWAGLPHQVVSTNDVDDYFVITIPLIQFMEWGLPNSMSQSLLSGDFLMSTPYQGHEQNKLEELLRDIARFQGWCEDFASNEAGRLRAARLEIHARLERFALSLNSDLATAVLPDSVPKMELTKAEQMAAFIAVEYSQPISVADVSNAVDLHPSYAMSIFSKAFGLTIREFIRQHRISHAQSLLISTNDNILSIGFAAGFQSASQFYDVFSRYCHCSPREYRTQHRK